MASTEPNFGLTFAWTAGDNGWSSEMDENLQKLSAWIFSGVISATDTAPPVTPANGDKYLVPAAATGAWSSLVGSLVFYITDLDTWYPISPRSGYEVRAMDTRLKYLYNGSAWLSWDDGAPTT